MVRNLYAKQMEDVLKSQISIIDDIYKLQRDIYRCVMSRDWIATQEGMTSLSKFAIDFSNCDKKAADIISEVCNDSEENFSFDRFISSLPKTEKSNLNTLYKSLKERVFLSKVENEVFNSYVSHAKDLVEGIFYLVADDRKGQTYTRTGSMANADLSNLVIDRIF